MIVIGTRYGKWTVLEVRKSPIKGRTIYYCLCDCGTKKEQYPRFLKIGSSTRCNECRLTSIAEQAIGKTFGQWKIISYERNNNKAYLIAECSCGVISRVIGSDLKSGKSTRCVECYNKVRVSPNKRHNLSGSRIYGTWASIKYRCLVESCKDYKFYGGRGITISDDWLVFENFLRDMGDRPEGMQIDRIDNNLGYSKENCRWVTPKENCNNRRRSGPTPKNN